MKTIKDVTNVNELAEYIAGSDYREETCGYDVLMCMVQEKISELYAKEEKLFEDDLIDEEYESENDDWMGLCGDERGMITLYRTLPTNSNGVCTESIEDGNIGMSWVCSKEDLDRIPWYNEDSKVVKVEVPEYDKTYIAFKNYIDRIIEVVLPNVCNKYKVEYIDK